jgi:hypothetical protein
MIRRLLGVAIGCYLTVVANAQPLPDVATDQELYAAYCLGVTLAQEEMPALTSQLKALGIEPERWIAEGERETKEILDRHIFRFRGYLAARGLLSGSRSVSAMTGSRLAKERGQADAWRCNAKIESCVKKYSSQTHAQKYINDCRDEENACRAITRCSQDDRLPF